MTQLEEYRLQMEKLIMRKAEYKRQLEETTDPSARHALRQKLSDYRTMIRELQEQIDFLDPPERKKAAKREKRLRVDALTFDWFERSGAAWSDLEGHNWTQAEAGDVIELGAPTETVRKWLQEAAALLSPRQAAYIDAYYNRGLSMEMIGEERGVGKSTVSRVLKNGLARMRRWVDAKRAILACADGHGGFDWLRFLNITQVFTDRQKELLLLILSGLPRTWSELADKLEIDKSTVSRTVARSERHMKALAIPPSRPTSRPEIRDWENADKASLALQTGMPLYFYYRYCFGKERVGGLTRYRYEMARRMAAGISPEDAAAELGLQVKTVKNAYYQLRTKGVKAEQLTLPDNSIGQRIDPETYVKLQRLVTRRADS